MNNNFSSIKQVAITFDDLPGTQEKSDKKYYKINIGILKVLEKYHIPSIGFVNEGKLHKNGKIANIKILKLWIKYGHLLGNHTYSHLSLSDTELQIFKKDVIKGTKISTKLMANSGLRYNYFRHPYLDTGSSKEKRLDFEQFLEQAGYKIAPVTIDTDDWVFNHQLKKNKKNKNQIIKKYIDHTKAKFEFYETVQKRLFGRNIRHIWLLHVNLINLYAIEKLLNLIHALGYNTVTLDQALEDEIYLEPNNFYSFVGVSWLYRWDYTRGKVIDWTHDPDPYYSIVIRNNKFNLYDEIRNINLTIEIYVSEISEYKAIFDIIELKVVIINRCNIITANYMEIINTLIKQGYFVVSIIYPKNNLNLSLYDLSKIKTIVQTTGMQNMLFMIAELKKFQLNLNLAQITLVKRPDYYSISKSFALAYPKMISKILSL